MKLLEEILEKKEFKKFDALKDFSINTYNDKEEDNLKNLYRIVFPLYNPNHLIEWQNKTNPFGNADKYTLLLKDKEKIISQYAVVPKVFYINGKEFRCIMSLGTMTHPDYRGRGVFPYLAKISYEYARRKGFSFVYGFPNRYSFMGFKNKLNWTILYKAKFYSKPLRPKIEMKINDKFTIQEVDRFDNSIDQFYIKIRKSFPILIKKDRKYLNWRFVKRPNFRYRRFLVYKNNSGNICSYFILKRYIDENKTCYGHIIDFLIDPINNKAEKEIFHAIENHSVNEFNKDCDIISFWFPNDNLRSFLLDKLNYEIVEMNNYFGFKIFEKNKDLKLLKEQKNWYNTMGENDLF